MSKKKQTQEILPWPNDELEGLLKAAIAHGSEIAKMDFKSEIETGTQEQKADLLKDIVAIANTYGENYDDYGFIVYGVKSKAIVGVTQTETDTDKFQSHIEQLLRTYISPMPPICVIGFETPEKKKWGAVVIPPRNAKPYMFFKDLFCEDRSRSRKKGEWFVRRGSTTDVGLPEDLAIITQRQMEASLEPIRESLRSLQLRVAKTEDQYNSALFKLVERALRSLPEARADEEKLDMGSEISEVLGVDLPTKFKQKLRTPKDKLVDDLIAEAKAIRDYLDGSNTGLPWAPQINNVEGNKKIISDLEERMRQFLVSIATIILNDHKGLYIDALLRALKVFAKSVEVPSGVQYNKIGEGLRYYPLYLILYTVLVCGVAVGRGDLLKQVLELPFKHPRKSSISPITDVYFYIYGARDLFNDAYSQRWCEPVAQRARQFISDHVGEMITDLSEPEYFFRGEFVLSLVNIDKCMTNGEEAGHQVPLGGLYLYFDESNEPILDFIRENPEWFQKLYAHPLEEILERFDRNAEKMTGSGCIARAMYGMKTLEVFRESLKEKK